MLSAAFITSKLHSTGAHWKLIITPLVARNNKNENISLHDSKKLYQFCQIHFINFTVQFQF